MNKKCFIRLLLTVFCLLFVCSGALAEEIEITNDINTMQLTIKGCLGEKYADTRLSIYAVEKDDSLPLDLSEEISETTKFKLFRTARADYSGSYELSNVYLSGSGGEYVFYVVSHNPDNTFMSNPVYLPTVSELKSFMQSVSNSDCDTVLKTLDNELGEKRLGISIPFYPQLSGTARIKVCEALSGRSFERLSDVLSEIVRYSVRFGITDISGGRDLAMMLFPERYSDVKEYADIISQENGFAEFSQLPEYISFKSKSDSECEKILSAVGKEGASSVGEMFKSISREIVFSEIKAVSGYGDIEGVLKKYSGSSLSGLKFSEYSKSSYKNEINKKLLNKAFSDLDELCSFINNYKGDKKDSSGFGGGSSGGGKATSPKPTGTSITTVSELPEVKPKASFNDLDGFEWASSEIEYLKEKSIISGTAADTFNPSGEVTREAFIKMVVLAFDKYDKDAKAQFSDCPEEAWYFSYVGSGAAAGIINGISENEFGTGKSITREDAAVILARAAFGDLSQSEAVSFSDFGSISDYAALAVSQMTQNGYINGYEDNTFRPKNYLTRAEACVILCRIIK